MLAACNDDNKPWLQSTPIQPSLVVPLFRPTPAPPGRDPAITDVRIGQSIEADIQEWDLPCTFSDQSTGAIGFRGSPTPCRQFVVAAPADGTLVVELRWDEELTGNLLLLKIEELEFSPAPPQWSPLIGRSKTTEGQRYRVSVGVVGYDLYEGSFVLTTRME